MSFVARELKRINMALNDPEYSEKYQELYAAQQALSWALDPYGFAKPYELVTDTLEGSKDYSAPLHNSSS